MPDNSKQLFIKPNAPTDTQPARYHIYVGSPNGSGMRRRIMGFSYFGEVGGRKSLPPNKPYVVLIPPGKTSATGEEKTEPVDEKVRQDQIRMTYAKWLDKLKNNKINMSRIFVYIDVEPEHCLFDLTPNGKRYNLNQPNADYFYRLKKYVEMAAERDIIVQITLAGSQTLKAEDDDSWSFHPMKKENNTSNKYLATNPDHPQKPTDGLDKFFVMSAPDSPGNEEQKWNYEVQSRTLDWLLDATSGYWNVIYELFNEPPVNLQPSEDARKWLVTTAKWLDERLKARNNGVRKHLVALNAPNKYLYNNDSRLEILRQLLFDENGKKLERPLIDVFCFHGMQWGGATGRGQRPNNDKGNPPLPLKDRDMIRTTTIDAVNRFYNKQFDFGGNNKPHVKDFPIAVIIDSDGQYCAQDSPKIYGSIVMNELDLDYNHRWSDFWLSKDRLTGQLAELKEAVK